MTKEKLLKLLPMVVAILLISTYRILPHPWNFAPVCAMAIFGGMYLNRTLAILLPIASMAVADLFLGMHWLVTPVIYGSIALSAVIGMWVGNDISNKVKFGGKVVSGTLASSVLFFVLTNLATWVTLDIYSKDMAGLIACFVMAIPFFNNALLGDMFFIATFVLVYEGIKYLSGQILAPKAVVK